MATDTPANPDKAYGSDDVLYKLIELLIEEEEGA